jgi:hypothetical protein
VSTVARSAKVDCRFVTMFMFPPIGRRSPHDAARHQRAATPLYFQAPQVRGFFFAWLGDARSEG